MTCIVGIIEEGNVYIGADSAGTDSSWNLQVRKDVKVFKNGDFIIGCTTSFRMIQLLRFAFKPPKIKRGQDLYAYMCTDFVDAIRKCFKDGGYLQKYKDGDDKGGTFLVGVNSRLFYIEDDFQVGEVVDNYNACGCGYSYALGALHSMKDSKMKPVKRVIKALEAAEYHNAGVLNPFIVISSENE